MGCIKAITAAYCFILFVGQMKVETATTCELSPYKPANSVAQLTTGLQRIVTYCEKKIAEIETRKKGLENQLKQLEIQNVKFAQEKRTKDKKVKALNEAITKLRKEIDLLQKRISVTSARRAQVTKRIAEAGRRIAAATRKVNQLQGSIRGKQAHIDALVRRINKEKAKRRCFGRKRRSVRAPRVRRGWRIRRSFRRIGRFVRRVGRETKRVVKQVVTIPKCIVNNIVSRLSRSKEKAEREKNRLNQQLLQAQRAKVNIEGDRRKLIAQRNADNRILGQLTASLNTMRNRLTSSNIIKVRTDREISIVDARIQDLINLLKSTDERLKFLREAKTKLLSILSQLKAIRNDKLADLNEMEEAGEDAADLLEDINEINAAIKKSVETLIQITCSTTFNKKYLTNTIAIMARVSNQSLKKCGPSWKMAGGKILRLRNWRG